jgi:hypothetical protein
MKKVFSIITIMLMIAMFSCKKGITINTPPEQRDPQQPNGSTICYADTTYDINSLDTLHRGSLPDTIVNVDSVLVVYRAVTSVKSSLTAGSRVDSVYYTGVNGGSIVQVTVGQQPDFQNWSTGIYINKKAFDNLGSRMVHLRIKFTLFDDKATSRGELQITYVNNGSIGKPYWDNYVDKCNH